MNKSKYKLLDVATLDSKKATFWLYMNTFFIHCIYELPLHERARAPLRSRLLVTLRVSVRGDVRHGLAHYFLNS